jgi:hypothetical protein
MVQRRAEGNGEIVEERKMVGKKNDMRADMGAH